MSGPAQIGKYLVRGRLGEGAMGVVYRAFDPHIQREVAIKVLRRQLEEVVEGASPGDSAVERFRNEARAVGRIAHPGVVTIFDFGEVTDPAQLGGGASFAYLVMELVEGRGLDQMLRIARPPLAWSLGVMDQLLDALGSAHERGVWHRDIKPGNLLIARDNRVKLTDFGIARMAGAHLTQGASQIGTPGYMAPEQYLGGAIDHRADLFACGVVLYRMATGRMPFSGSSEVVMYQTLHHDPSLPSALRPNEVPAGLDAVVRRAMARDPQKRFADAAAMRAAIAALATEVAGLDTAAPAARPRSGGDGFAATLARTSPSGGTGGPGGPGGTNPTWTARPAGGLDPDTVSRIERALATHIGPLAKHLVAKDLARSGSVKELSHSLARHLADAPEREQFLAAAAQAAAASRQP